MLDKMFDKVCEVVASILPKRVVSHCVIRVLTVLYNEKGIDPKGLDWFEALNMYDPYRKKKQPHLTIVK